MNYDVLVSAGAHCLTTKSGNNTTIALSLAKQFEYERLIQLIKDGADVETVADSGLSVVGDVAKMQQRFGDDQGHPAYILRIDILKMLQEKGLDIPSDIPINKYEKQCIAASG